MKKIAWLLAVVMMMGSLAACSNDGAATTPSAGSGSGAPQQSSSKTPDKTTKPSQSTTKPTQSTTKPQGSSAQTTQGSAQPTPSFPEEDVFDIPNAKAGDTQLKGYAAAGDFTPEDGKLNVDMNSSLLVVTNDRMSAGKLTANFTSLEGSAANDNGIVFGMEENTSEDAYYFWEEAGYAAPYYILFISDAGTLYLARVAYNGEPWHMLYNSDVIVGYAHGATVTVSVEFDGQGYMKCYANDEMIFEFTDTDGPRGSRYGVRAEVYGVVYNSLTAEHAEA